MTSASFAGWLCFHHRAKTGDDATPSPAAPKSAVLAATGSRMESHVRHTRWAARGIALNAPNTERALEASAEAHRLRDAHALHAD
jgi:hypothetical protein